MGGEHFHRCRECKIQWICAAHKCDRYDTYCRGNRCAQNVKTKVEKPRPPQEPGFFDPPAVNQETSIEAAESIKPTAGTLRKKVLEFIQNVGPATDEEMQRALKMPPNTQRPRRRELVLSGHLMDSGEKRKTDSGRRAVVWTDRLF